MLEELHSAYAVLGLDPSAGPEEVRAAYLDFVKILHPDRYHNEPERLRLRAERKLKEVTEAYRKLDGAICIELAPDPIPMDFGERWGYIGESGETRIHPQFDTARNFRRGVGGGSGRWEMGIHRFGRQVSHQSSLRGLRRLLRGPGCGPLARPVGLYRLQRIVCHPAAVSGREGVRKRQGRRPAGRARGLGVSRRNDGIRPGTLRTAHWRRRPILDRRRPVNF